ncbi:MAG: preprotein translocase subunit YajC [Clostridia bacterium]|nr:preprotein translocase subunit YajC [Clostridia bacterium]
MNFLRNCFWMLAETTTPENSEGGLGGWPIYLIFGVVIVLMIVMTVIPNRKKRKEYEKMQSEIRPGTKVMTIGRMIGTVVRVYDNGTLEVDVGTPGAPVVITINREAIGLNLDAQAAAQAAAAAKSKKGHKEESPVEEIKAAEESAVVAEEPTVLAGEEVPVEEKPAKKEDDAI